MAETLWNPTGAAHYLLPNYPCNSIEHAHHLISCWMEDGIVSSWYRLKDGKLRPIDPSEWQRGEGEFQLQWLGWSKLPKRYVGFVEFLIDGDAVRDLCPSTRRLSVSDGDTRKPGPDGLRLLLEEAAQAVLPNGQRPTGMFKKTARRLMSDYLAKLGHARPHDKTYRRHGY